MADEFVYCASGHSNSAGYEQCGVCGLPLGRPSEGDAKVGASTGEAGESADGRSSAFGPRPSPTGGAASVSSRLLKASTDFGTYATIFTILTALGALAIGWALSQETTCNGFSCDTETDGGAFFVGALASFVGGMLLVLPLRGISFLLLGVANLLKDNELQNE